MSSNVMNTLFVNNLLRLQWEHLIQFVAPLDDLPEMPLFFATDTLMSDNSALDQGESILFKMKQTQTDYGSNRVRYYGPHACSMQLRFNEACDSRDSQASNFHHLYLQSLLSLYENFLIGVTRGCWLPSEPDFDEPMHDISSVGKAISSCCQRSVQRNKRDQIEEARFFINQKREQQ